MFKNKILLGLIVLPAIAWAQDQNQVKGKITNQEDKPVINVKVILNDGEQIVYTNNIGEYQFSTLNNGSYDIRVDDPEIIQSYTFIVNGN